MPTFLKQSSPNANNAISKDQHRNIERYDQSLNSQHICPCCSYPLLRHIDRQGIYWYCSHCHQEMPAYN